jgi:hypothetical protein
MWKVIGGRKRGDEKGDGDGDRFYVPLSSSVPFCLPGPVGDTPSGSVQNACAILKHWTYAKKMVPRRSTRPLLRLKRAARTERDYRNLKRASQTRGVRCWRPSNQRQQKTVNVMNCRDGALPLVAATIFRQTFWDQSPTLPGLYK